MWNKEKNINQSLSAGVLLFAKPIKTTLFKPLFPLKLIMHFTTSSLTSKTIALIAVFCLKVQLTFQLVHHKPIFCFILLWPSKWGVTRKGVYPFLIGKSGVRVKPLTMSTSTFRHHKTWCQCVFDNDPKICWWSWGGVSSGTPSNLYIQYMRSVYSNHDVQDYRTLDFQRLTHYG